MLNRLTMTVKGLLSKERYAALRALKMQVWDKYAQQAYSQEGEDMLLRRLLIGRQSGFYVDVGAHHPTYFSNTHRLYKRGWHGINIDPTPDSMLLFDKMRPRDVNLELAISNEPGKKTFHIFNVPALNTFDEELVAYQTRQPRYRVTETREVVAMRLSDVLEKHLPPNTTIDLLTIDAEGHDLMVVQSNDWERFRPKLVLVECHGSHLMSLPEDEIYQFMLQQGYVAISKLFHTVVFQDANQA